MLSLFDFNLIKWYSKHIQKDNAATHKSKNIIMKYPYSLVKQNVAGLFGQELQGEGCFIDLSDKGDIFDKCNVKDQVALQKEVDKILLAKNTNWAISDFGERRERFFKALDAQQMVAEERFYHLGLDIWMPVNTQIYAPLDGIVVQADYEDGYGNYGGYIVLKHNISNESFYSFYGHLNPRSLPAVGDSLKAGDKMARLGDMENNGGYFFHTHLQVLTEEGYKNNFVHKGYATDKVFATIENYVLDPRHLFTTGRVE